MSNTIKWLWLTLKRGITPHKISKLLEVYGNIDEIYAGRKYAVPHISPENVAELCRKDLGPAERVYQSVRDCGASILTFDNKHYPTCLRNIKPIPYVLYVRGRGMDIENMFAIGMVGTRINTDYGADQAARIAYGLGKRGAVIVSGLAAGIDSIAMSAALKAGGRTIGVLGCGIDQVYPQSNRRLFDEVVKTGLIISEYPPGTQVFRGSFPQRNRIIAGLSRGVLVVEGSRSSGSMITAKFALEYNRDVFAIPRNIGEKNAYGAAMDGTNYLIRTGASLVCSAKDILSEYGYATDKNERDTGPPPDIAAPEHITSDEKRQTDTEQLIAKAADGIQKEIIKFIGTRELFADEIAEGVTEDTAQLGTALTIMETMGLIKRTPDGKYKLNC